MAKITCFELEPSEKKYLKAQLPQHTFRFVDKPLTSKNASYYKETEILVIFIGSKVTQNVFEKMPRLQFIATMSTGYDHIDIEQAQQRNVHVSSVPFYGQHTVAEHAFGLLQALNRHLIEAIKRTREGNFDFTGLCGTDLRGKTLGVLGTGHIGQHMIDYAKAFGMKVLACDARPNTSLARKKGFKYVRKKTLLQQADFISLHLPLCRETKHYLDYEEFSLMKPGALLINTGRGPLINTKALLKALDSGVLGGAALDVLEAESQMKKEARYVLHVEPNDPELQHCVENHQLLHRENVLITPHLAFYTTEALQRIADTTVKNIKGHLQKRYKNKVC